MTVENGNKLIAEFIGLEKCTDPEHSKSPCYYIPSIQVYATDEDSYHDLKYHSSWDWLMPVVEKINRIKGHDIIIYKTTVHVNDDSQILLETTNNVSIINAVWDAVVQFIQWYNSTLTNKTIK